MLHEHRASQAQAGSGFTHRLWRWLALLAGGVIALLVALSLLQCSLKKPEAPSWDATLRLPVASDRLSIANLLLRLENGDQFVDEAGNVGLFFADTLDTVVLAPDLSIPAQFVSLPQELGRVTVASPPGDVESALLSDYYAGPAGSIPAFDVFDIDTLGPLPGYTWIAPGSGEGWLKVDNQTGLPFDSVTLWLSDLALGPLGTFDFPGGVAAGTSDSLPLGIAGRRFYNRFGYQLFAHTPGGTLLSLSNRYLDVSIGFTDSLALDSGLLEVPQVVRAESDIIGFSGNGEVLAVTSALLSAGQMALTVQNGTNLMAGVTVAVPSFTLGGVPLSRNLAVQAHDTVVVIVNLTGYLWVPEEPRSPQYFVVNAVAATVPTAPQQVRIDRTDSVGVSAGLSGLQAQRVTGILAPKQVPLPSFQQNLSIPSELSAFHPAEVSLAVELVNGTGAASQLSFSLSNNYGDTQVVSGFASSGDPDAPVTSYLYETGLAAFLDPFPSWVRIDGLATFGDSTSEFTLTPSDFAFARITVSAPLAVRIDTVTIGGEVDRLDIQGSDVDDLTRDLLSGLFHADLGNHLPVGADVTFLVASDSALVFSSPDLVLGPVTVAAGVTQISGLVADTSRTTADLSLDHEDLALLGTGTLYVGYRVFLHGSAGQVVRFLATDYLAVLAHFDLILRNGKEVW